MKRTVHSISIPDHLSFKLTELCVEIIPDNSYKIEESMPSVELACPCPEAKYRNVE